MSYRCAIREVQVGIDSRCRTRCSRCRPAIHATPASSRTMRVPYMKLRAATKSVSVELTYRDGSVSEIKSFRR